MRRGYIKRKTRIKPRGKKTKLWDITRTGLIKPRFQEWNIISCELRGVVPHECTGDNYLGFAHSKKRRFLTDNELETEVILACTNGHNVIEHWSHEDMEKIVLAIVESRIII